MSIADKITRLQTAKAAIASAITGKGGTVSAGDGYEDFAADIATIPSGITPTGNINITGTAQVDVTNYATAQVVDTDLVAGNIKQGVDILGVLGTYGGGDETVVFDYKTNSTVTAPTSYGAMTNFLPFKKVRVILPDSWSGSIGFAVNAKVVEELSIETNGTWSTGGGALYHMAKLKKANLEYGSATWTASSMTTLFRDAKLCEEITGTPFSFANFTADISYYLYDGFNVLREARFAPNTLSYNSVASLGNISSLSDDTLVSYANAANESVTKSIGFSSLNQTRMRSIMGNVDTSAGYSLFVKDSSGTLSLMDFITNTKGWTVTT